MPFRGEYPDNIRVPIQDISVLLGHEGVNTTERIYINRRKTAKETTINTLDSAINLNRKVINLWETQKYQ